MSLHERVESLEDDHPLSAKKVKSWIKTNKERLQNIRHYEKSKDWKERLEYQTVTNYIKNLQTYLRTGVYNDHRYGSNFDKKMHYICYAPARDKEGNIKRNVGTWYKDVGLWTEEMRDIQNG